MIKEISKWTLALTLVLIFILALSSLALAVNTFIIQETDAINVNLDTSDPDGDDIVHYFEEPLDDNGYWQTNYDDAGEYFIDVTASDGIDQTVEEIKIIVENKNREPVFMRESVSFSEGDLVDLTKFIVDPDDDVLDLQFEEPFDENGLWQTGYADAGIYLIDIVAGDSEFEVQERLEITIEDVNQAPDILEVSFSNSSVINIAEDETLLFSVAAEDFDENEIYYQWKINEEIISDSSDGEYYFDFDSSGEYTLTLIVSDTELETEQSWEFEVDNTNRVPELNDQSISVYETELLEFSPPPVDQDGDELSYVYEYPLDGNGQWQTGYNDAGSYDLTIEANDGEFSTEFTLTITVIDLDRAPELNFPDTLEVWEGENFNWGLEVVDLDDDSLSFEFAGWPSDIDFSTSRQELEWNVSYDYIVRNENFVTNFLNALRLEHYFMQETKQRVGVKVCGKELCTSKELDLIVHNTNRAPSITAAFDQNLIETESVELYVAANDPDGDIVKYYFSKPLSKRGGKWTTGYEDEGEYTVYVTATDGFASDTEAVKIYVDKNNRIPTITIKDDEVVVNEGQEFMVRIDVSDPDWEDELQLSVDYPPAELILGEDYFLWAPSYDTVMNRSGGFWNNLWSNSPYFTKKFSSEKETVWLDFTVSDGEAEVVHPVKVVVKNINRLPVIEEYYPAEDFIETTVGDEPLAFGIDVSDLDGDSLEYRWSFSDFDFNNVNGDVSAITREFTLPGEKKVRVTVDDGRDTVEQEWT
ncbi:MAG: PKD domain-containing protein, partial [Nanoarchaeota archaeon]|nr:PKD domain-containing protein [Nanoarchaeota archaeon]